MNKQALKQARTQLESFVQYGKPSEFGGLWIWWAGPYSAKTGFSSKSEAEQDFQTFLNSDLQLELKAKSGGRKDSVRALTVAIRKRSRGSRYPDELLEFADQFEGTPRQRATAACRHGVKVRVVGRMDGDLIRLVENDISYYDQQQQKAA